MRFRKLILRRISVKVPITPPTRQALSRDRIVDEAIRLAAAEGVNGLSMRRLAHELGVHAMSLYHWVPSKAALLVLMADQTVAALADPDPHRPWQEQLLEMLMSAYRAGVGNPAVMPVIASALQQPLEVERVSVQDNPSTLILIGRVETVLATSGLPEPLRVSARHGLIALIVGAIVLAVDGLLPGHPSEQAGLAAETALRDSLQAFITGLTIRSP